MPYKLLPNELLYLQITVIPKRKKETLSGRKVDWIKVFKTFQINKENTKMILFKYVGKSPAQWTIVLAKNNDIKAKSKR